MLVDTTQVVSARYSLGRALLIFLLTTLLVAQVHGKDRRDHAFTLSAVSSDYQHFYSQDSLIKLGCALSVAGMAANIPIATNTSDTLLQKHYQNKIRNNATDDAAELAKITGEVSYIAPLIMLSLGSEYVISDNPFANWGALSARAYVVGAPAMLMAQRLSGASRPVEATNTKDSQWQPLTDSNGVSGHAFAGAVPFLVLARTAEQSWLRYAALSASFAAGLSRINDDAHYASQVALGWYMAKLSTDAVSQATAKSPKALKQTTSKQVWITPMAGRNYVGLLYVSRW